MCEGTVLPHCAHLFSWGACQRLAALRVRNRILEVLRLGTPMSGGNESTVLQKNNQPPEESDSLKLLDC